MGKKYYSFIRYLTNQPTGVEYANYKNIND